MSKTEEPQTVEEQIKLFRAIVSNLVEWHSPLPKAKHEKLVSDIMLHVPKLLTASNIEARIEELEKFIDDANRYGHRNGNWELEMKLRLAKLKGKSE